MTVSPEFKLSSSLEDYLEAIRNLEKLHRVARVKDIANSLKVKMPSVTGALKILREKRLINYEKNSFISLTKRGMEIANTINTKHKILNRFLEEILLLPRQKAQVMACKLEHSIDSETIGKMNRLIDLLKTEILGRGMIKEGDWKQRIEGE